MTSDTTRMAIRALSESATAARIFAPTDDEIAAVAYQLWLDSGCPSGWDREHWRLAETILRHAFIAQCEDLSRRRLIPGLAGELVAEFTVERWDGHWEVWEREWGGARWVWDARGQALGVAV